MVAFTCHRLVIIYICSLEEMILMAILMNALSWRTTNQTLYKLKQIKEIISGSLWKWGAHNDVSQYFSEANVEEDLSLTKTVRGISCFRIYFLK